MKVMLLKEVRGLGRAGDVKTVSDGYGQNFLFARGLAKPATPAVLHAAESDAAQQAARRALEQERFRNIVTTLQKTPLAFTMNVNAEGRAFGSVTVSDIHQALAKKGITLDRHWIELPEPIKTTGDHIITIAFPHHITGEAIITLTATTE